MSNDESSGANPGKAQAKINIKVNDEAAKGTYANMAIVHNSDMEFIFDYIFMEPQRGQGHVVSRVIANPKTAKRLMLGLNEIIAAYEKRFGEILLPKIVPQKGTYH